MNSSKYKLIHFFIALAVLVNFSGLFVTIMAPDAAMYADISKTMVLKNNYIEMFRNGVDWLDKPHFPFWITAIFFKIFGFSTWAYKLPGILFMMMGAWYTYLLAKKLYNKDVALLSVLILLTAQHIVLSNQDVRAEPYLTGLIIASVYHFYNSYTEKSFLQLIIASFFAGCAIMTKGPFAIIPIGGAIAGELFIKKNWKDLFHFRWLIAAILIFIFITPELYSLYFQFDKHPEKTVFGTTHVSGIKFFFWDSQFGRFFNNGPIKGEGDPFFFFHTTLWAFLPWSILLYVAFVNFIRKNYKNYRNVEWLTICGSLLTFVVFSLSKFQLPHYLNIVFPFFAIITAQYLYNIKTPAVIKNVTIVQMVFIVVLIASPIILQFVFSKDAFAVLFILVLLLSVTFIVINKSCVSIKEKIAFRTAAASFFINLFLNFNFYPTLLKYQSASEAAFWINKNNKEKLPVIITQPAYPLEFYLNEPITFIDMGKDSIPKNTLIYLPNKQMHDLALRGVKVELIKAFEDYPVTQLGLKFINKNTRRDEVELWDVAIIKQ